MKIVVIIYKADFRGLIESFDTFTFVMNSVTGYVMKSFWLRDCIKTLKIAKFKVLIIKKSDLKNFTSFL